MPNEVKELRLKLKSLSKKIKNNNENILEIIESVLVLLEDADSQILRLEKAVFDKQKKD